MVICPNPKCRKAIKEPILLTVLSVTPPKEYEACPHCFTDLTPEPQIAQEYIPKPTEYEEVLDEEEETGYTTKSETSVLERVKAGPRFLKRVKDLLPIPNAVQKEKEQKPEEPQAELTFKEEEPETEVLLTEEPEEEPETEFFATEEAEEPPEPELTNRGEVECSGCPKNFGYLANRPPGAPIPTQCLVCSKMVDCMLSPRESD